MFFIVLHILPLTNEQLNVSAIHSIIIQFNMILLLRYDKRDLVANVNLCSQAYINICCVVDVTHK